MAGLVNAETVRAWGATSFWAGLVSIGAGVLQLVAGFGLLAGRCWAWALALVMAVLSLVNPLVGLANGDPWALAGLTTSGAILLALLSPQARQASRGETKAQTQHL